ncbi:uncharacterized protein LOC124124494 isoform X3 [Haliotis rufescens]|uniref:uncharacterized protein LOC124124494 isoform X3 n=1 Tax=Haliotis rufescens TaxID=6454 RepID=UPI00201EEAC1|nr:uncharacterized protein LOC124124494 isoform X3 [Haliotis rufescens]
MGLSGELPISCYLPLIVAVVCCTSNGVQSTHCPRPVTPIVVTKLTQRNLMMDPASYTQLSMSLPVKCVSEAFVPLDDEGAKCENGQWVLPNTKCVPLIYRERKVTNTIMTICAAVGGVLAATFIIVKVICYRRSRGKGQRKSRKADDNMEMTSNGGVPTVSRGVTLGIDRRSAHYDEPSALSGRSSRAYSHHTQPNHNQDVRASQYSNGGGFRPDVGGHRPGSHVISAF